MKPFRIPFFALALGIALVFAFLLAGTVFAQDEVPPAPVETPAAEVVPPAEEAAPVVEPLPTEEPPAVPVEEPAPVEEAAPVVVEEVVLPAEEPGWKPRRRSLPWMRAARCAPGNPGSRQSDGGTRSMVCLHSG